MLSSPMNAFDDYQEKIHELSTLDYSPRALELVKDGLAAESGEVAGCFQKYRRVDFGDAEFRHRLKFELGDVLWHVAMLAEQSGFTLSDIVSANLAKVISRNARGVIKGDGDKR